MKRIVFDVTNLIVSSINSSKFRGIKSISGDVVGVPMIVMGIIRECSEMFPDYIPDFVISGGYSKACREVYPKYKEFNKYYEESLSLSDDSDSEFKDFYNEYIKVLSMYLDLTQVEGVDHEYILAELTNGDEDYVIVTEDDELAMLLRPNCKVYRPYESTLVNYSSYLRSNGITDKDFSNFYKEMAIIGNAYDKISGACVGVGSTYSADLLKLVEYLDYDLSGYDKESLKSVCEKIGVHYRSAYMNFNKSEFDALCRVYDYRNAKEFVGIPDIPHKIDKKLSEYLGKILQDSVDRKPICTADINGYKVIRRYGN